MPNKATTTIKFEVQKFDEKSNYFVVEDARNIIAREGGHTQGPTWY